MAGIGGSVLLRNFRLAVVSATFALSSLLLLLSPALSAEDLAKAEARYQRTDYEGSLALVDRNSPLAAANFLLGRNFFMTGQFKKATDSFLKAAALDPKNAEYMDWLGRTYGKRAELSNPLMAPGLAARARQAFEKSAELDPKNSDALSDLFDYYLQAPGFLGGGYDKASAVAEKIATIDPSEGYFEQSKLAQKRKEFDTAEQHLRRAIAAAAPQHQIGNLIELAKFLAKQGRTRESDAVFQQAQKAAPNAPELWFAKADMLIKQNRNLDEAKGLLQKYMQASTTVDDPPKQEARRLLKQVGGA
jgi:tetratricopeptide (TPR) repeat protein